MYYSDQSLFGVTLIRIKNDVNGNPRYLIDPLDLARIYEIGAHIAKKMGATKFRGKGMFKGFYVIGGSLAYKGEKEIIRDIITASLILEKKEIFALERHRYAPELNKLHTYDGDEFRVPQATNFAEAKQIATELHAVNFATFEDVDYLIQNIY